MGSYMPFIILNNSIVSPRYCLYLSVGNFEAFNRSLYGFLDNSGINFVALFCTHSNLSTSIFLVGYYTLLAYSAETTNADASLLQPVADFTAEHNSPGPMPTVVLQPATICVRPASLTTLTTRPSEWACDANRKLQHNNVNV